MTSPLQSAAVSSYGYSNSPTINALLPDGTHYRWAATAGAGTTISYSFPTAGASWSTNSFNGYGPVGDPNGEPWNGFSALSATQQAATRAALAAWAEVANLHFVEVTETATNVGDIRVANSNAVTASPYIGWAYYPWAGAPAAGDIWLDPSYGPNANPAVGNYGFLVLLHELGHALGLEHPFHEGGDAHYLTAAQATTQYSVMAYNQYHGVAGYAATPMLYDIAAIQFIYGANMTTRTGDDTYSFGNAELKAIWDAGGEDTFDLSNQASAVVVDLQAGHFSSIGTGASNNIAIAFGATIEHAIGTAKSDSLTGNEAANRLTGGDGNDSLIGLAGNDTLDGGSGNDLLDGGKGIDILSGGIGDDTYVLDDIAEAALVTDGGGYDTILTKAAIGAVVGIENYAYSGRLAWIMDLSGDAQDHSITGGTMADKLTAGDGNDRLDGGSGADLLTGGAGNDTYVIDNFGDQIIDTGGTDTVLVNRTISLTALSYAGVIENVTLTGTARISATGNGADNMLIGNGAANLLDGGAGADVLIGGLGNDVYTIDDVGDRIVESVVAGVDTVKSALDVDLSAAPFAGQEIENVTLVGAAVAATGNGLNNIITGNAQANTLEGGGGIDTLVGGHGDDLYYVDSTTDNIVEATGIDTVESSVDFSLAKIYRVENLTLAGSAIAGTGNWLANTITGTVGGNLLDGGTGADVLIGGDGSDTYIIDNARDAVIETAVQGHDLVRSSVSYVLANEVEDLTLTGTAARNGTGNGADNAITGNAGRNVLIGGAGDDTLTGGFGSDTFRYDALSDRGTGLEIITDFTEGRGGDVLDLRNLLLSFGTDAKHAVSGGFLGFADDGTGNTVVLADADGGGDTFVTLVSLIGVSLDQADTANLRL